MQHLNELERQGLMSWRSEEHAWVADPDRVVQALRDGGFQEYKREIAKDNRSHATSGGMWQSAGCPHRGRWTLDAGTDRQARRHVGGRRAVGRLDAGRTGKGANRRGGAAARGPDQGELDATSSRAGPGIVSPPRRRGVRVLGKPRLVGKRWQDNVEGAALRVVLRPEPALVRAHNRVTHR